MVSARSDSFRNVTESTCAALTAVFPLVLLAFLSERRSLRRKLRRTRVYRRVNDWISMATILGLGWTLVGVQLGGLTLGPAIVAWVLTAISLVGLLALAAMHAGSAELDESEIR
ncbi:hypothetical protein MICABA_01791 [Microbacterium sp. T2.11-28]|nr:hypothetical protein MICABA_01791 [Microbacterium sp. T2.11-28]